MIKKITDFQDYRIILIDIFFAIILTTGLQKFFDDVVVKEIYNIQSLLTFLFFVVTFFWVVSYWVIYHIAIHHHPYFRWRKFYVDIVGFSFMFMILNLSILAPKSVYFPWFIFSIIFWHFIVCLWHLSDLGTRRSKDSIYADLYSHIFRIGVYVLILLSFLIISPLLNQMNKEIVLDVIMVISFLSMFILSSIRLKEYIKRDEKPGEI